MSEVKYRKAKAWMGKDLSLHVGGGDKKIFDSATLTGPEYAKFVGMGFLEVIPPMEVASERGSAPAPVPQTQPAQVGTKSPSGKVADSMKSTQPKGGKGAKNEADEAKAKADAKDARAAAKAEAEAKAKAEKDAAAAKAEKDAAAAAKAEAEAAKSAPESTESAPAAESTDPVVADDKKDAPASE